MVAPSFSDTLAQGLPEEMLAAILNNLSARDLCPVKATCRAFAQTINCLLRLRLVKLVTDTPTHELVFESSSPSQTRSAERQRVELGRFHPQISVTSTLLADLTFPKPGAVLQHLLLDEDEQFGGLILGLSLRGLNLAYEPPHRFSAAINNPERFSFAIGVTPTPAQFPINLFPDPPDLAEAPSAIHNRPDTPPSTPPITWSISLADGFDRLFRAWFENPALPCPHEDRPCAPTPAPRRATATHTLEPAPRGGLREARLRCVQVAPTACGRDLYGRPQGEVAVFEYTYESLVVDVARVLVRMEEGIEQGRAEEAVVVLQWLRL